MTGRSVDRRSRGRWLPSVVTDLPVLAGLVLCWATVAVFWAHVATGLALIVLAGVHLCTRRRPLILGRRVLHLFVYAVFLAAVAATVVTGLARWGGVPPRYVWHGGISYLVLGLATVHLWSIRRILWARIRRLRARLGIADMKETRHGYRSTTGGTR